MASAAHGSALPLLGGEPQPGLVHQPAAVLRRPIPGLVSPRRDRRALASTDPLYADEGSTSPIDPQEDVPPGFTVEERGIPGGFTGIRM